MILVFDEYSNEGSDTINELSIPTLDIPAKKKKTIFITWKESEKNKKKILLQHFPSKPSSNFLKLKKQFV